MLVRVTFAKEITAKNPGKDGKRWDGSVVEVQFPERDTVEGFSETKSFMCSGVKGIRKPGLYEAELVPAPFGTDFSLTNFREHVPAKPVQSKLGDGPIAGGVTKGVAN